MNGNHKLYLTANEIAVALGVSRGLAYKMIRKCNAALAEQGYLTIAGRVPIKYFAEKYYGFEVTEGDSHNAGI